MSCAIRRISRSFSRYSLNIVTTAAISAAGKPMSVVNSYLNSVVTPSLGDRIKPTKVSPASLTSGNTSKAILASSRRLAVSIAIIEAAWVSMPCPTCSVPCSCECVSLDRIAALCGLCLVILRISTRVIFPRVPESFKSIMLTSQ